MYFFFSLFQFFFFSFYVSFFSSYLYFDAVWTQWVENVKNRANIGSPLRCYHIGREKKNTLLLCQSRCDIFVHFIVEFEMVSSLFLVLLHSFFPQFPSLMAVHDLLYIFLSLLGFTLVFFSSEIRFRGEEAIIKAFKEMFVCGMPSFNVFENKITRSQHAIERANTVGIPVNDEANIIPMCE